MGLRQKSYQNKDFRKTRGCLAIPATMITFATLIIIRPKLPPLPIGDGHRRHHRQPQHRYRPRRRAQRGHHHPRCRCHHRAQATIIVGSVVPIAIMASIATLIALVVTSNTNSTTLYSSSSSSSSQHKPPSPSSSSPPPPSSSSSSSSSSSQSCHHFLWAMVELARQVNFGI